MEKMGPNGILKIKVLSLVLFFSSIVLYSCRSEEKNESSSGAVKSKKEIIIERPDFDPDSAYHYIETQVSFGPRVPNTEAHKNAGKFLSSKLELFGFEVTLQDAVVKSYDGKRLNIKNIIGEYKKQLNNRILLFAHWDSRHVADQDEENTDQPIAGANDGASGTGILLEVARQIQRVQPNIGVDIVFFDAEDYGQPLNAPGDRVSGSWCLGSQYFVKHPHRSGYRANFGILLDMVGAKDAQFTKEAISRFYAPSVLDKVWNIASKLGHSNFFVPKESSHVGEDDHLYINKFLNIPSIDIIQFDPATRGFAPHWHTHDDNMGIIHKSTLAAVGETVLATVFQEAH